MSLNNSASDKHKVLVSGSETAAEASNLSTLEQAQSKTDRERRLKRARARLRDLKLGVFVGFPVQGGVQK
jgi:hypothetical protein